MRQDARSGGAGYLLAQFGGVVEQRDEYRYRPFADVPFAWIKVGS
jgi:hypothetical protein